LASKIRLNGRTTAAELHHLGLTDLIAKITPVEKDFNARHGAKIICLLHQPVETSNSSSVELQQIPVEKHLYLNFALPDKVMYEIVMNVSRVLPISTALMHKP
jgi:hypothetical protein